jgi:DNA-binding NtrC family response regulator
MSYPLEVFEGAKIALWRRDPRELEVVETILAEHGCYVHKVSSREQMRQLVAGGDVDLVMVAVHDGQPELLDWLDERQQAAPALPVVAVAGSADVLGCLEALQHGALDGVELRVVESELLRVTETALEWHRLKRCACRV